MEFQSLEDVVRVDLSELNHLLFQRGGKKEAITLYKSKDGSWYSLLAKDKEFSYGSIEEINQVVKALYRLVEHPGKYDIMIRSWR